mgnify:CR=1 FL=1
MNEEDFVDMRNLIDSLRIRIEQLERVVGGMKSELFTMKKRDDHEWENREYE